MRHSFLAVPFLPAAALAADAQVQESAGAATKTISEIANTGASTGMDQTFWQTMDIPDYGQIFGETGFDLFQQLVNVNKLCIELIDSSLEHYLGVNMNAFGLSLIIYTCVIKTLIYPLYEGQLRSTARMRKVQPVMKEIQKKYGND